MPIDLYSVFTQEVFISDGYVQTNGYVRYIPDGILWELPTLCIRTLVCYFSEALRLVIAVLPTDFTPLAKLTDEIHYDSVTKFVRMTVVVFILLRLGEIFFNKLHLSHGISSKTQVFYAYLEVIGRPV